MDCTRANWDGRDEGGSLRRKKRDCPHSQSQWNMHWPHNAKIWLADAWSVDNKLSTIKTIEKLMMAEALQECLSRFPKTDTLKAEQSEALEALISSHDVIAILLTGFGKSLIFQLFCEVKPALNPNTFILVVAPLNQASGEISVKWGWLEWLAYTTPTVHGICTFAIFFSVSRPFMSLQSSCYREKLEPLDHAMANFKNFKRS